jgi:hypothetical protein
MGFSDAPAEYKPTTLCGGTQYVPHLNYDLNLFNMMQWLKLCLSRHRDSFLGWLMPGLFPVILLNVIHFNFSLPNVN